jgi:hypothetical protein
MPMSEISLSRIAWLRPRFVRLSLLFVAGFCSENRAAVFRNLLGIVECNTGRENAALEWRSALNTTAPQPN